MVSQSQLSKTTPLKSFIGTTTNTHSVKQILLTSLIKLDIKVMLFFQEF